jgi:diacylglycerol O-acyltransferase
VPLYLAGAKMLTYHPLSIVTHGLALNITIQTYAGSVDFGLIADKKAVPDLQALADAIQAAFAEAQRLYALTNPAPAPVAATKSVVTPRPRVAKVTQFRTGLSKGAAKPAVKRAKAATVAPKSTPRKKTTRA